MSFLVLLFLRVVVVLLAILSFFRSDSGGYTNSGGSFPPVLCVFLSCLVFIGSRMAFAFDAPERCLRASAYGNTCGDARTRLDRSQLTEPNLKWVRGMIAG
jgi:hypothetical protein